jgi:hypothetical protein
VTKLPDTNNLSEKISIFFKTSEFLFHLGRNKNSLLSQGGEKETERQRERETETERERERERGYLR